MKLNEERIIRYLNEHVGETITSLQLVRNANAYEVNNASEAEKFEIEDAVTLIAKENGFVLDKSNHDNKIVGFPFNLDFVIKRMELKEDLIYRESVFGTYMPEGEVLSVYDRSQNNLVISSGNYYPEKEDETFAFPDITTELKDRKTYTISQSELNTIKSLIRESGVLDITSIEAADNVILDGTIEGFFFRADGKEKVFERDNFRMIYSGSDERTNAGKIISLAERIGNVLKND